MRTLVKDHRILYVSTITVLLCLFAVGYLVIRELAKTLQSIPAY